MQCNILFSKILNLIIQNDTSYDQQTQKTKTVLYAEVLLLDIYAGQFSGPV